MTAIVVSAAVALAAINVAPALLGAWSWRVSEPSKAFWALLRTGQAAAAAFAAFVGVLAITGAHSRESLFYLYALLPLAVSFVAEQLRVASAQMVLDRRGLPDAQAVGKLAVAEQHEIVRMIVRREIGVMAISAAVVVFLALRAAGTAHGF